MPTLIEQFRAFLAKTKINLPKLYQTETEKDPVAYVKFFTPDSSWSWWVLEWDGEDTFFGLVKGLDTELGYFSLSEIDAVHGPLGIGIEVDLYFTPTPLSKLQSAEEENE